MAKKDNKKTATKKTATPKAAFAGFSKTTTASLIAALTAGFKVTVRIGDSIDKAASEWDRCSHEGAKASFKDAVAELHPALSSSSVYQYRLVWAKAELRQAVADGMSVAAAAKFASKTGWAAFEASDISAEELAAMTQSDVKAAVDIFKESNGKATTKPSGISKAAADAGLRTATAYLQQQIDKTSADGLTDADVEAFMAAVAKMDALRATAEDAGLRLAS